MEEKFLDYLQDFINDLEDSKIVGISSEVLAWYDNNENVDETIPYGHKVDADLSTGGLLGWLTGQNHHLLLKKISRSQFCLMTALWHILTLEFVSQLSVRATGS